MDYRIMAKNYQGIINAFNVGVCVISRNMEIIAINDLLKAYYPNINVDDKPICYKSFHEPAKQTVCEYCPTVRAFKEGQIIETIIENNIGGVKKHFKLSACPIFDDDNNVIAATELVEDITDRIEEERKIKRTNETLEMEVEKRTKQLVEANEKLITSFKNLQRTLNETVNALVSVGELKDPYTAGHQHRVSKLALAIAQEIGFSESELEGISISSKLHDIGKIYVPLEILNKPSKLTELEMVIIKTHSEISYKILEKIPFNRPVAEIAYQHHERLDGSGYPRGLKENQILMEAKIIAVADVVEAMASHRPYRPAVGLEKALEEILINKGKLYDPMVVETCLDLFSSKQFCFETYRRSVVS